MTRWTAHRKYRLVQQYRAGQVSAVSETLQRHSISTEEFNSWLSRFEHLGIDGLKVTQVARAP